MKTRTFALAFACALAMAACAKDTQLPQPNGPVVIDDECPRADGEPCR